MSNQKQFEAILASEATKICVIAGPGSGKTKGILIPKAQNLIGDGVDPKRILLLSFSRLSAQDLKKKVETLDKTPSASTVHSFCLRYLLQENDHAIRDRISSIALEFEIEFLLCDLKLLFPKIDKRELRKMYEAFSAGWAIQQHDEVFESSDLERKIKNAIVNWLSEHKAVLMSEIVYFAVENIRKAGKSDALKEIDYILVDEYQDLNKLEQEFVNHLGVDAKLLLTVGDPDQSIYSFKFAHPDGIRDFYISSDVSGHTLPYCGRCDRKILEVANQLLLQENPDRGVIPKALDNKEDGDVQVHKFRFQDDEFSFVYESIRHQIESGTSPADILVLVPRKKLGDQYEEYAQERARNEKAAFGFQMLGNPNFTARQQESILTLALLANPESIIHTRAYIGLADASGKGFAPELAELKRHYNGWAGLLRDANPDQFPAKRRRVRQVCNRLRLLRNTLDRLSEGDLEHIIAGLFPEDDPELAAIQLIIRTLQEDDDDIKAVFNKFTDYLHSTRAPDTAVRIITLMGSKGLEAPHVYILGCNAGNIPGRNFSETLDDLAFMHEQRRLLYVGFTRAQRSVTITWTSHIPYQQAKNQNTQILGVATFDDKPYARVGICPFLEDLDL